MALLRPTLVINNLFLHQFKNIFFRWDLQWHSCGLHCGRNPDSEASVQHHNHRVVYRVVDTVVYCVVLTVVYCGVLVVVHTFVLAYCYARGNTVVAGTDEPTFSIAYRSACARAYARAFRIATPHSTIRMAHPNTGRDCTEPRRIALFFFFLFKFSILFSCNAVFDRVDHRCHPRLHFLVPADPLHLLLPPSQGQKYGLLFSTRSC